MLGWKYFVGNARIFSASVLQPCQSTRFCCSALLLMHVSNQLHRKLVSSFLVCPSLDHRYGHGCGRQMARSWQADLRMTAAAGPNLSVAAAVKCYCHLLFSGFHGLCEAHFLRLNTLCQGRKGPISELLCPVFDWKHLTATGSRAPPQMRYPSALGRLLLFHNGFIFFLRDYNSFTLIVCYLWGRLDAAALISSIQTLVDEIVRWTLLLYFIYVTPNRVVDTRKPAKCSKNCYYRMIVSAVQLMIVSHVSCWLSHKSSPWLFIIQ